MNKKLPKAGGRGPIKIQHMGNDNVRSDNQKTTTKKYDFKKFIFSSILLASVCVLFVFTNHNDLLKELITYGALLAGGFGYAYYKILKIKEM